MIAQLFNASLPGHSDGSNDHTPLPRQKVVVSRRVRRVGAPHNPQTERPSNNHLRSVSDNRESAPKLSDHHHSAPKLSKREVEVLLAWLAADSKEEAAATLFISASTVSTHLTRIRAKYAEAGRPAKSKANLFARAIQDGHTDLNDW